jgi:hypothetical protein
VEVITMYGRTVLCLASAAFALALLGQSADGSQMKAFQIREDFGPAPLSECYLQYYYYVPCPTDAWFWGFEGPDPGEIFGQWFVIGDVSMASGTACDPAQCHTFRGLRLLDFAGYGTVYPGMDTIELDAYCADAYGCPLGPSLWSSGPCDLHFGWNYVSAEPAVCLTPCYLNPGPPATSPRILVTVRCIGTDCAGPVMGLDNISTPIEQGCEMHDVSSLPALYPRPYNSHYTTIHSGYYGYGFQYCPPLWITDGRDTTPDGSQYGFVEWAWRIYLACEGPTSAEAADWSTIKSMYR